MHTAEQKLNAICRKLSYQFPQTPPGKLFFAIVEMAIKDLVGNKSDKAGALRYLQGDMPHAMACGVEPDYVRRVLAEQGFLTGSCKPPCHSDFENERSDGENG